MKVKTKRRADMNFEDVKIGEVFTPPCHKEYFMKLSGNNGASSYLSGPNAGQTTNFGNHQPVIVQFDTTLWMI